MLRDLTSGLQAATDSTEDNGVRSLANVIAERVALTEQAVALQRDFPNLGLGVGGSQLQNAEARWIAYGTPAWLVGTAGSLGGQEDIVVAVVADSLFTTVEEVALGSNGASVEIAVASGGEVVL